MKIIVKIILPLLLAITFTSCKKNGETGAGQGITINVAQARLSNRNASKEFPFIAKPFRSSELSFRVSGPIDQFEVYAGNYYPSGSTIARIDARDFHIRRERTEAIYNQAKAEFERIGLLYEKNNISASTFEKAKADYTSAKTAFATATNELNDTKLAAPFNGYVGDVYIEKYQDVKAAQPIVSFIDIDRLKIETYVTQDVASQARQLKKVNLRFDAMPHQTYEAQIVEISKNTTPNNLSYLLTALVPNPDGRLLAGMSGKLSFDLSAPDPVVTIPQTALCHRPSVGDYVWIVNPQTQKVAQREITSGELLDNGYLSVNQGVQENEIVATSGLRFLSEGTSIQVFQEKYTQPEIQP